MRLENLNKGDKFIFEEDYDEGLGLIFYKEDEFYEFLGEKVGIYFKTKSPLGNKTLFKGHHEVIKF